MDQLFWILRHSGIHIMYTPLGEEGNILKLYLSELKDKKLCKIYT